MGREPEEIVQHEVDAVVLLGEQPRRVQQLWQLGTREQAGREIGHHRGLDERRRGGEARDRLQRLALGIDLVVDEELERLADPIDERRQRPVLDHRQDGVADQVGQIVADVL